MLEIFLSTTEIFQAKQKGHPFGCPFCFGGDKRDRTADLLNAIQALSQLSYTPIYSVACPATLYTLSYLILIVKRFFEKT